MLSPRWYWGFLVLLQLDICSHWFQMNATMAAGAPTHKARSLCYSSTYCSQPWPKLPAAESLELCYSPKVEQQTWRQGCKRSMLLS